MFYSILTRHPNKIVSQKKFTIGLIYFFKNSFVISSILLRYRSTFFRQIKVNILSLVQILCLTSKAKAELSEITFYMITFSA